MAPGSINSVIKYTAAALQHKTHTRQAVFWAMKNHKHMQEKIAPEWRARGVHIPGVCINMHMLRSFS